MTLNMNYCYCKKRNMRMRNEFPIIYHQGVRDTYLTFILENMNLIVSLRKDYEKLIKERGNVYTTRAKSLQIKSLIGITTEHLIKIVLLKRGFIINIKSFDTNRFNSSFLEEVNKYNSESPNQERLNSLLQKSLSQINEFSEKLLNFDKCIKLFRKSNPQNYFNGFKKFVFQNYLYLEKYSFIDSDNALKIIQDMRNSYIHRAEGNEENNYLVLYLFNFILFVAKKEFQKVFDGIEKIKFNGVENLSP